MLHRRSRDARFGDVAEAGHWCGVVHGVVELLVDWLLQAPTLFGLLATIPVLECSHSQPLSIHNHSKMVNTMNQPSQHHCPTDQISTPTDVSAHGDPPPIHPSMFPRRSIASLSLGRAWVHGIETKLDQAAANNYNGIELFYEDLQYFAKTLPGGASPANQVVAARQIREMCGSRNLTVTCLQPFMHYEGLLDRARHAERIRELSLWFQICHALGTDLMVIPSNFLAEGITGDWDVLVADMQEVADLGAQQSPVVRIAYEALCFGVFVNTWSRSYELVVSVDRRNFGICLDTFNICGRDYADPASTTGCIQDADAVLQASLTRMRREIDVSKIFLVQVADAEKMREPLREEHAFHVEGQVPRMSWSRNARLFPGEKSRGAYLPVLDVMRVLIGEDGLGYSAWVSFEVFSRTLEDACSSVPEDHARRGKLSFEWMEKMLC